MWVNVSGRPNFRFGSVVRQNRKFGEVRWFCRTSSSVSFCRTCTEPKENWIYARFSRILLCNRCNNLKENIRIQERNSLLPKNTAIRGEFASDPIEFNYRCYPYYGKIGKYVAKKRSKNLQKFGSVRFGFGSFSSVRFGSVRQRKSWFGRPLVCTRCSIR